MQADGMNMTTLDATKLANGDPSQLVRLAWMLAYHYGTSWMIGPVRVYRQIFHIQQAPVVVQPPQGNEVDRRKERKSVGEGKNVYESVDIGGSGSIKKKKK